MMFERQSGSSINHKKVVFFSIKYEDNINQTYSSVWEKIKNDFKISTYFFLKNVSI